MKRSEMIKKLREYFDECGVNLQFSNRALAINVLDEIEKIERQNREINRYKSKLELREEDNLTIRLKYNKAIKALEPEIMCFCSDGSGVKCERCEVLGL